MSPSKGLLHAVKKDMGVICGTHGQKKREFLSETMN
jgi:hypothetical protein